MGKHGLLSRLGSADICSKIPLVELASHSRVLIENHTGVLAYSPEEISVKVSYGSVSIIGQGMMLAEMQREQLVIIGEIYGITLHRR